jgi:hypothetical protein
MVAVSSFILRRLGGRLAEVLDFPKLGITKSGTPDPQSSTTHDHAIYDDRTAVEPIPWDWCGFETRLFLVRSSPLRCPAPANSAREPAQGHNCVMPNQKWLIMAMVIVCIFYTIRDYVESITDTVTRSVRHLRDPEVRLCWRASSAREVGLRDTGLLPTTIQRLELT